MRDAGLISECFYQLLLDVFSEWDLDTGNVEGKNCILKRFVKVMINACERTATVTNCFDFCCLLMGHPMSHGQMVVSNV